MGLIDDLKAFVAKHKTEKLAVDNQGKAKLDDGVTVVTWDTEVLAQGSIVNTFDTTGAMLPLPLGDYTLEDGTTFSIVDEMGMADKVVIAEAPEEEAPAAPVDPNAKPQDMNEVTKTATAAGAAAAKTIIESTIKESRFVNEDFVKAEIEKANTEKENFAKEQGDKVTALETKVTEQENLIKEMFSLIEKLGTEGAEQSTEGKKNAFTKRKTAAELSAEFKAALK